MSGPIIPSSSSSQAPLSRVYVRARQALAALAREAHRQGPEGHKGSERLEGLGDEDQAAARLLGVAVSESGGLRLDVASDGLKLDGKSAVETALREGLGAASGDLTVYFKKRSSTAGPAPVAPKNQPFGITVDRRPIPGVRDILVVASGKGGVGKSTVSVNLAVALAAAGAKVGLLDADIYGPSAPMMMGLNGRRPMTERDKLIPLEAHGVKVMSFGFLTDTQEPAIWRGPLIAKAFKQLAYDVAWGELDYLVIDLPPGTGDIQLALVESVPIAGAVIVTTPQDVALLDAHKALSMFERLHVRVLGLVENMAHFHCPKCGHEEPIFGAGGADRMAEARKLTVLTRIPLAADVRARGDRGDPVALDPTAPGADSFKTLASAIRATLHA